MLTLRPTKMLAKRLKLTVPATPPPVQNRVADWCVHEFSFGRRRWLIACNTATLYPYVLSAKGVRDESTLIFRVAGGLAGVVAAVGGNAEFNRWIEAGPRGIQWAPIPDRVVLSSVTELAGHACFGLADGIATPQELSRWLAQTPMKAIGYNSPDRAFPKLRGGA